MQGGAWLLFSLHHPFSEPRTVHHVSALSHFIMYFLLYEPGRKEVECRAVWFCPRNKGHHDSRQETVMGRFDWLVTVQGPAAGDPRRPCTVLLMPLKKYQLVHRRPSLCCWKSQWFLTSLQCGKLSSSRGGGVRMLQSILARKGSLNPSQKSSHLAKYKLLFSREGQWGHGWEGGDSLPGLTVLRGRWVKLGWNCQALQAPAWSKVMPAVPGVLEPLSQTFLLLFGKT